MVKTKLQSQLGVLTRTVFSLIILAVAVLFFVEFGKKEPINRLKNLEKPKPTVETVAARHHQEGIRFQVDGVVIPFREIRLSPEVAGRVVFKADKCRLGSFVQKGECLFRIDPSEYQLEVRRLEEDLCQAENNIEENLVEINNTQKQIVLSRQQWEIEKRDLSRYESVKDPGVYSASAIDAARQGELVSRNTLLQLENHLRLTQAKKNRLENARDLVQTNLERAELDLRRTEVFAPLDGLVTEYNIEEDCYVQRGTSVITIQDTSCLEIRCSLHMQQIHWLWQTPNRRSADSEKLASGPDQSYRLPQVPVEVRYELDGTKWIWQGYLSHYDGAGLNSNTRMLPCRVTVDRPRVAVRTTADSNFTTKTVPSDKAPPSLMAGMFVQVAIFAAPQIELVRIPETALLPGNAVWTANEGRLSKRQVRVATTTSEGVLVYADQASLQPNDQVIISPLASPTEGLAVNVVQQNLSPESQTPTYQQAIRPNPPIAKSSEANGKDHTAAKSSTLVHPVSTEKRENRNETKP